MKTFSVLVLLAGILLNSYAQRVTSQDIQPVVAGSFYPADESRLKSLLEMLFRNAIPPGSQGSDVRAIIVPHAGYEYSGAVAASGFNQLDQARKYKRVFILATSHRMLIDGAALYSRGDFMTPLGRVAVDRETAASLIRNNSFFTEGPSAFTQDHVLEVQLPFLQFRFGSQLKIVPVMIGTQSAAMCRKMANALRPYFNAENLFVISSDFSHYPAYADAKKADHETAVSIISGSPEQFLAAMKKNESANIQGLVTSCCSWPGVLTFLYLTSQEKNMELKLLEYKNSGDTEGGDRSRVVGYNAIMVIEKRPVNDPASGFTLSPEDKRQLLALARKTVTQFLKTGRMPDPETTGFSETLKTPCGAFVTLKKEGQLRGCIGNFSSTQPLFRVVRDMALASAFQDTRFNPVTADELPSIEFEISVLTPFKKIKSADEFTLGKHGIYMVSGSRSGTFLPQVADETKWSREEFLGHCARDKAGIGWDGWKTADLYTYEAIVFSEQETGKAGKK